MPEAKTRITNYQDVFGTKIKNTLCLTNNNFIMYNK